MKSSVKEMAAVRTHAQLDRRYAERVPTHLRVLYVSETGSRCVTADGLLINLSKTGCKVVGTTPPLAGSTVTLFLYLEDGKPPVCLTGTTISWVSGLKFAARFPTLNADERKRVQEVVWKHATLSTSSEHRTAFRIASMG